MKAVILAAGDGGRLGPYTATLPKPLVALNGRWIIDYTIDSLAAVGGDDITVVVGYREAQLRAALAKRSIEGVALSFVTNARYETGASLSLRAARASCGDAPFLLVMSDHVLTANLLARLIRAREVVALSDRSFIAADFSEHTAAYADESTKLALTPDGRVTAIGKQIEGWSALDTGAFLLAPAVWDAVDASPEDCELSIIFSEVARRGLLYAAEVSGEFWYDIDTTEDLAAATTLLAAGA